MRIGKNPLKSDIQAISIHDTTFVTITYIPQLTGYWEHSLEVLKVMIDSLMVDHTIPFNIMIIDNGSCSEVTEYLQQLLANNTIQFLILSTVNLGKIGAFNLAFKAAPGKYIAYADSDVFFSPGWLKKSLEIFQTFPKVGCVTARPIRMQWKREMSRMSATYQHLESHAQDYQIQTGLLIDQDVLDDFNRSCGLVIDANVERVHDAYDTKITKAEVSAYVGSTHFQFVVLKELADQILPLPSVSGLAAQDDHTWDQRIDQAGYLKLCLTEPYVYHLGNSLAGETIVNTLLTKQDTESTSQPLPLQKQSIFVRMLRLFMKIPYGRTILIKIYNAIFNALK